MSDVVRVDASSVDRSGASGAVWSLPHDGDLDANLVTLGAGDVVGFHVNDEVDLLIVTIAGSGRLTVDDATYALAPMVLVSVPKGAIREVRAGDEALLYLTVHGARAGLSVGRTAMTLPSMTTRRRHRAAGARRTATRCQASFG